MTPKGRPTKMLQETMRMSPGHRQPWTASPLPRAAHRDPGSSLCLPPVLRNHAPSVCPGGWEKGLPHPAMPEPVCALGTEGAFQ